MTCSAAAPRQGHGPKREHGNEEDSTLLIDATIEGRHAAARVARRRNTWSAPSAIWEELGAAEAAPAVAVVRLFAGRLAAAVGRGGGARRRSRYLENGRISEKQQKKGVKPETRSSGPNRGDEGRWSPVARVPSAGVSAPDAGAARDGIDDRWGAVISSGTFPTPRSARPCPMPEPSSTAPRSVPFARPALLARTAYFRRNNIEATACLAQRYADKATHFVFVGSSMMYEQNGAPATRPTSPMRAQGVYSASKLAAFEHVKRLPNRWAAVLPCIIAGAGRGGLFRPFGARIARFGAAVFRAGARIALWA